jgi:DNA polymerase-3 subunit gamma/tau
MSYIVTARKWRPKNFIEVVGQEHITTTIKNAIKNNRIAHAYLFTGPRGVGKTTTARILAKAVNCLNLKDGEPCNECELCKSIQNSRSLDIIEIDGASNRGIDEIRTLRDSVKYAPSKGKYKVYIIDEVHMLTRESFNAFLKTLEEPPSQTIFIFATTDVHKVPLTIISRCQRFDFRRIQLEQIKSLIKQIADAENIKIDDKSLTIIGKKADGALRDAESYFDQVASFCGNKIDSETVAKLLNLINDDIYFEISDAILDKNFKAVFEVSNTIYQNGWNFIDFIDGLVEHFRNILSVVVTGNADTLETADSNKSLYMNYTEKFSEGDLLRLLNYLNKTQQELRYAQNQKLKIEIALTHLIGLEKSSTLSEILSKIDSSGEKKTLISNSQEPYINHQQNPPQKSETVIKDSGNSSSRNSYSSDKVKSKTSQSSDLSSDFAAINEKWENFIDEVGKEKGLTLGPFLKFLQPHALKGNVLDITCTGKDAENIINMHLQFFDKISPKIFGRVLKFNLLESFSETKINRNKKDFSSAHENDPYKQAIIEELGGHEID